jgi:mannose/fructose/N-acetylgalactosamine-specific phosphotransferase system component IIC
MTQAALSCALIYLVIYTLDPCVLSWQCLNRPMVVAPITGLVLGDFRTGIIMGASLESIFMGISAIGGAIPADATTSSIIAVAYTILTGASAEEGLALAMPIGTVMASFNSICMSAIGSPMASHWEKEAQTNIKRFNVQCFLFQVLMNAIPSAVLFVSVAYGVEGLNSFLSTLPAWVMNGLSAASSMMVGVGFAILTSMIWDKEVGVFFFVGYVLAAYLGLSTLPIAILGTAAAVCLFYSNKRVIDLKQELTKKGVSAAAGQASDEEDFF